MEKLDDDEYVTKKLNEVFFKKLKTFGGGRNKDQPETFLATPNHPSRSKSLKERRRSSVIEMDKNTTIQITKPKRRNSGIQDERSIHDAYHALLNEYNRVRYAYLTITQ